MTYSFEIDFTSSFNKKTDPRNIQECIEKTIAKTTLRAETDCKKESPVQTGALRRGHSSEIHPEEGLVKNSMNYAPFVVHGTKYQDANNYPERVMNELASKQFASNTFKQELKRKGITG